MESHLAQYELALMRSRRTSDNRGNVLEPDLIEADFWFRLGARDSEYDNSQVRGAIEPKLTTAQLDQVKQRIAGWKTRFRADEDRPGRRPQRRGANVSAADLGRGA